MAYADYEWYRDNFLGDELSEEEFPRLSERAGEYIDYITFDRARAFAENDPNNAVKKACCAVASAIRLNENGGEVVSETVGKITRNYSKGVADTPNDSQRLYEVVSRYLIHTGLLYLGVE